MDFWVCDLETTTPDSNYFKTTGDVTICLAGAMHSSKKVFEYDTAFIRLLDRILSYEQKYLRLYFHNLGQFDGSYILHELEDIGYTFNQDKSSIQCFINDAGNIYNIRFIYRGCVVEIFDSLKLLTLSVADLGKSQGLPKLESNYTFEPLQRHEFPPEDINYLKRDCEIVIQPLLDLFDSFKNPKMTAGSTSVQGLFDFIGQDKDTEEVKKLFDWLTKTTYENAIDMLPFCFGGLTFYNRTKRNKKINGVYCYDANSFYPTQMVKKKMIIGSSKRSVPTDYETGTDEVALLKLLVVSSKLKGDVHDFYFLRNFAVQNKRMSGDGIPSTKNLYVNRIEKPTVMYMFECEFQALQKWYDFNYTVLEKTVYDTDEYMRDYIQWLYDERKKLKAEKNPKELTLKIILNSTFGKFMENPVKLEMVYLPKGVEYQVGQVIKGKKLIRRKQDCFDFKKHEAWVAMSTRQKTLVRNPIIGAYITALARTELMNLVLKYREHVVYGDTDSIFLTCKIPEFETCQNNLLGEWKNEYPDKPEGISVYIYGRKRYVCFDEHDIVKFGMCGVSKKLFGKLLKSRQFINEQDFKSLVGKKLDDVKLTKRTVNGKKYLSSSFYEIKQGKD